MFSCASVGPCCGQFFLNCRSVVPIGWCLLDAELSFCIIINSMIWSAHSSSDFGFTSCCDNQSSIRYKINNYRSIANNTDAKTFDCFLHRRSMTEIAIVY
eukprot:949999_1